MKKTKAILAACAAISLLGTTSCVVREERPAYVAQPAYVEAPSGEVYATEAPPQPEYEAEAYAVPPGPDVVWVGGFWVWDGGHWGWRHGYWGRPPHPGAVWVGTEWHHGDRGWERHEGHWR